MRDLDVDLHAICAGDRAAFGRWVAGAELSIRASLRSFAARVDVEALVQETLLRMWQVAPRVESDGKPNALLRLAVRTSRNLAISEIRRARTTGVDVEALEQMAELVEIDPPDPMLRRSFEECRDALPDKPRASLVARITSGGGDSDEVLAERLSMRTNTFLQNITRAKKLLRDCLEGKGVSL